MRAMSDGEGRATLAAIARREDTGAVQPLTLRLPEAGVDDLGAIREFVSRGSRQLGADEASVADLVQAVDESATNVIRHGYGGSPGPLDIEIGREGAAVRVDLRDRAPGFDPRGWPDPDLALPLEARKPGGFGVYLTRTCVDQVDHRFLAPAGNQLTLYRRAETTAEEGQA